MSEGPRTRLAYERPETAARLRQVAAQAGLFIEADVDLARGPLDVAGCQMLIFEQSGSPEQAAARVYSLAGANPDLLIVCLVPPPRASVDRELLRAGAFDVLDGGPNLESDLAHTLAAAGRVVSMQRDRHRLSSTLAHQDKIASLGVLAAGVSHEINNPCAAILSNMAAMREQIEAVMSRPRFQRLGAVEEMMADSMEALSDCISAANRIHSIVKTLNVFSRRGDEDASIAIDVNEEVSMVLRLIGKEVKYRSSFEVNLAEKIPRITGPANSVTQVVTNLVVNAMHALESRPQSERRIWVTTQFDEQHVMLEVGDNGPGIASDVLARIFDPFFTTKPIGQGTGLGLSITRQLVQQMGGDIFVDSAPGEGARFSVFFERRQTAAGPPPAAEGVPPTSERLRVLMVDDDLLFLRALQRSLRQEFEISIASTAADALTTLAADRQYDVVVSDVIMPEMDGVAFYRRLAAHHPALAARTMFLTGGVTSEALRQSLAATGRPCLGKPFEVAELTKVIRALGRPDLQREQSGRPVLSLVQT